MTTPAEFWTALFPAGDAQPQGIHVPMRVLRKHGRPFLLLPGQRRTAAATLALYPAQTARARAARTVLRGLLGASLPVGTRRISLPMSPADGFTAFLTSLAGGPPSGIPPLGILAGNPASDSQRFILLVFDAGQRPVAIAKAGLSGPARDLIKREAAFLAAVPRNTLGAPRLRSTFESPRLSALALDYFAGDSPRQRDHGAVATLVNSWVDPARTVSVSAAPDWVRLERAVKTDERFLAIAGQLREVTFHPVVGHGDFAPWNIKVSPQGAWTVLDWERGELTGVPAWDWFHYVIQTGILVKRLPLPGMVGRVESLLASGAFKEYARRTAIVGSERPLVLAYLLHCAEVIKPAEGLAPARELLGALAERWRQEG